METIKVVTVVDGGGSYINYDFFGKSFPHLNCVEVKAATFSQVESFVMRKDLLHGIILREKS